VRPETLAVANPPLVARQAGQSLAQAWGGGLVAAVDGMCQAPGLWSCGSHARGYVG